MRDDESFVLRFTDVAALAEVADIEPDALSQEIVPAVA